MAIELACGIAMVMASMSARRTSRSMAHRARFFSRRGTRSFKWSMISVKCAIMPRTCVLRNSDKALSRSDESSVKFERSFNAWIAGV